jgi:hypothetical protein
LAEFAVVFDVLAGTAASFPADVAIFFVEVVESFKAVDVVCDAFPLLKIAVES